MARNYDPKRSSVSVGDDKKKRGLLPLLLGLAALIILLIVIGLVSCGDDDNNDSTSSTPASSSTTTTAAAPQTPAPAQPTLTAASQSLLGGTATGIKQQVGQDATGTGLEVLSVTKAGFFVGTGPDDRQFVEYGGKVGEDETAVTLPEVGDRVDLTGPVRPAPQNPGRTLRLEQADADLVSQRGAFINADTVTSAR